MKQSDYIKELTRQISDKKMRQEIEQEIADHIQDQVEEYVAGGMDSKDAYNLVIEEMGEPEMVGQQLNKIHRKYIDVPMLIYYVCWSAGLMLVRMAVSYNSKNPEAQTVGFILLGCIMIVIGFIWSAYEKWNDLPLLYAWGKYWAGCAVSNSGLMLAAAVMGFSSTPKQAVIVCTMIGIAMTAERAFISHKKNKREAELLWEVGVAETEVNWNGKVKIHEKVMKVSAVEGETIAKGMPVLICDLKGFRPIVQGMK